MGPLSERALLAASEREPDRSRDQLARAERFDALREVREQGQVLLEALA